jgi:hypothetical protein
MRDTENDEMAQKEYAPYLTNKALSYYTDTILYANEMNRYSGLDNIMQYEYLLHSVRPKKRFTKWSKKVEVKEVQAIAAYFQVNTKRAEEYYKVLDPAVVKEIVIKIEKI